MLDLHRPQDILDAIVDTGQHHHVGASGFADQLEVGRSRLFHAALENLGGDAVGLAHLGGSERAIDGGIGKLKARGSGLVHSYFGGTCGWTGVRGGRGRRGRRGHLAELVFPDFLFGGWSIAGGGGAGGQEPGSGQGGKQEGTAKTDSASRSVEHSRPPRVSDAGYNAAW